MIKELVPVVFLVFSGKAVSKPEIVHERPASVSEVEAVLDTPQWQPCIYPYCAN